MEIIFCECDDAPKPHLHKNLSLTYLANKGHTWMSSHIVNMNLDLLPVFEEFEDIYIPVDWKELYRELSRSRNT